MNEKLLIVDGNSILNRAFYAIKGPRMLTRADGTPTNAVYGFINILNKYIEEEKPDYLAVAFDLKAKTFRHYLYDGYKATRKGMPDELACQLPIVKQVLNAMNIPVVEVEGLEADDLIGIYSKAAETKGLDASILTGDRDALQLVSNQVSVIIPTTSKGQTTTTKYTPAEVMDKYGIVPCSLIEVKALMGDPSDNIPGVKGVGEKTALELIKEYGSIDALYGNLQNIKRAKLKANLEECRELAYLSRTLGIILREREDISDISELKRRDANKKELLALYQELEFNSLIKKMNLDQEELAEPGMTSPETIRCTIIRDGNSLAETVNNLSQQDSLAVFPVFEKTGKVGGSLALLGIGSRENHYCIIPDHIEDALLAAELKKLADRPELTLVGVHIKEFYTWSVSFGLEIRCHLFDMLIAEYLIDALSSTYSVSSLAKKYLGLELSAPDASKNKEPQLSMETEEDGRVEEIGRALSAFYPIYEKQKEILSESGQNDLYYNVELPLSLVLGSMEYYGFQVDENILKEYGERLDGRIRSLGQSIYIMAGEEFNINSPKQLGVILFEKMGLKAGKKTKTGYSTDADTLTNLSNSHEIIPCILEYRQLTKLKSTYAEGLAKVINPQTGRIHSSFNQTVTATGRISSTEPNLQNIPIRTELGREIRKAFIPKEGYMFVDADYSQIELRVLAHITGDEMLQKAFVGGVDIHTQTASQVFRVPIEEVTSDMRRSAKAVNFGIIYGISDFSLAKDINVTRKEAARYIENYLSTFGKVREYMENIVNFARDKGYVETMFHRIRYIPELKSSNFQVRSFGKRVALNTPIQGSAADIIKIAMVKVWRELKNRGMKSRLILQVHDELVVETAIEELDQVKEIIKRNMEGAVGLSVPLIADVSTGCDWYEAK
ncbi:MAG TPA: DNA polymerase I [Ruminiclostridium sp.]|nr:DNA polymerase I [Ruminiclostridium sp.]